MIYYVDIDGTICCNTQGKYEIAKPYPSRIEDINKLYDEGNTVIYWTARGSNTGIDWTELTKNQLDDWGVKYHEIKMWKPHFDIYICDKSYNSEAYFENNPTKNEGE
jgi:uncharacterized HAD superfamily protein|tara:strand:- start:320 stop:640 length:321 start_codon:yes stop_codon:yes gene_type:complete